ncbi:MAG: MarR family transcriptional regulator [Schumannella sp.]|nr:MarR family transcriptional regulator [Microbacteriaceae bacterium]
MAEQPLAFWLALVDRLVEERFSAALEEHGVTRTQWRILGVLGSGPASAAGLEGMLAEVPTDEPGSTATDELSELVESGWVTAGESYTLTERGAAAHDRIDDGIDALRATLTSGLSEQEQAATASALERMARNLGWTEQSA